MTTGTIKYCRVCASSGLVKVLDLGTQAFTGIFPVPEDSQVPYGPLELLWCRDCNLVQLSVNFPAAQMYGDNYGYRSGLNQSMVKHICETVARLVSAGGLSDGDVVLDIGSNDGTLLNMIDNPAVRRIGIDPTAQKFLSFYDKGVDVISELFSSSAFWSICDRPAKIVSTLSMFYDLPDPINFALQVRECMARDGIWLLEQSYLPSMLRTTSYDTVCHEHIEYYSLATISLILEQAGLRVADVRFNRVNGGSFAVMAVPVESLYPGNPELVSWLRAQEVRIGLDTPGPFRDFEARVFRHRSDLRDLIETLSSSGKRIMGLGASTKGNVLLQFCELGPDQIEAIVDVNVEKHGRVTPGSGIPIISELEARRSLPDYFLVLPWHFRDNITMREAEYLRNGGSLIFPLPEIEIVGG